MAAEDSDFADGDRCATALEAALSVAVEECLPDEALDENVARMVGAEPDEDCEAALEEGLDAETCEDFAGVRQWVSCRAVALVRDEDVGFSEAMETAWDEAKTVCANTGHPI